MSTVDMPPDESHNEQVRYGEAMAELETLLDEIDSDQVDLDELADKVERASHLIEACRDKIERTEMQVKAIIDDLDDETGEDQ